MKTCTVHEHVYLVVHASQLPLHVSQVEGVLTVAFVVLRGHQTITIGKG